MVWQPPKAPRGTVDILPDEVSRWQALEAETRALLDRYGYREIRTPMFESTELYVRGIGEVTDIVEKEMFTMQVGPVERRESISLRPEFTAGIVRAVLEHNLHRQKGFWKLYSIGPAFRYERPQAGRQRQFHQLDVEALGSLDPLVDVETIELACRLFSAVGLAGVFRTRLNTLGCAVCRNAYREVVRERLRPELERLCESCRARFERNVFRILDCKNPSCKEIVRERVPSMEASLCAGCAEHFAAVRSGLDALAVPYEVDATLVRGFDYYTRTVYEFPCERLGAQDALGGGGRYDRLVPDMGGPEWGAVGFGLGLERILLAMDAARKTGADAAKSAEARSRAAVFVAVARASSDGAGAAGALETAGAGAGARLREEAFRTVRDLRQAGVAAEGEYEGRSLKAQLRSANKEGYALVAIVGAEEIGEGAVKLKDMSGHRDEARIERGDLVRTVREWLGGSNKSPDSASKE